MLTGPTVASTMAPGAHMGFRTFMTPPVLKELKENSFTKQCLKPVSERQYDRYDNLPQDPYQKDRLHGFDLFHAVVGDENVVLNRLDQQVFSIPSTNMEQKAIAERRFGRFDEEFLRDEHVKSALNEIFQCLPLANFKNQKSFAVGIHAFKLHMDPATANFADATVEGVHRDGAEIIMINFAGSKNVANNSAQTYIWTLDQPKGQPDMQNLEQLKNLIVEDRLNNSGEYFMVLDQQVQHHIGKILPHDASLPLERKVMVIYVRDFKAADRLTLDTQTPVNYILPAQKNFVCSRL